MLALLLSLQLAGAVPPSAPAAVSDIHVDGGTPDTAIEFDTPLTLISPFNTYEVGPGIYIPDLAYKQLNEEVRRLQGVEKDTWRSSNSFFIGLAIGLGVGFFGALGLTLYLYGILH